MFPPMDLSTRAALEPQQSRRDKDGASVWTGPQKQALEYGFRLDSLQGRPATRLSDALTQDSTRFRQRAAEPWRCARLSDPETQSLRESLWSPGDAGAVRALAEVRAHAGVQRLAESGSPKPVVMPKGA